MKQTLVDTGPLVALIDKGDADHLRCRDTARQLRGDLVTTWPVITEAMYLLEETPPGQDALLQKVEAGDLILADLSAGDLPGIRELMRKYRDQPMDLADASVVRVAQRDSIVDVFTLDKHFRAYRTARGRSFAIKP
ncbi:MAG: type II toxin-antitoxin system VapC family toxin [bacterium]